MIPKLANKLIMVLAGAGLLAAAFVPAQAADDIKLRVADSLPVGHFFVDYATKYWMEEVTKQTDGQVTFDYFPAEQLGKSKDLLALTQSGVADVAYVVPSYVSDKMPLSSVAELPGSFADSCTATMAYLKLSQGDGILAEKEFAANDVRMLYAIVLPPYQVFTGKKELTDVSSIAGLKLRTAGGAMDTTVKTFDGVPVRMAAPDLYESLARGTVDGMLFPYASLISYDLPAITSYGTTGENFGSAVLTYLISEKRWNELPENVREIMHDVGIETTKRACRLTDEDTEKDIEIIADSGVKFITFEGKDRDVIDEGMQRVNEQWAQDLDARGKPGSEVLKAFQEALADD